MKLSDIDISKMIPAFMRDDDFNAALAGVLGSQVQYQAGRIDLAQIWSVIDSLPEDILDELAKELDVNWFLYDADIAKKREIIKRSDEIHRHLGSKWAVEEVVKIYFGTGTVIEWWEDGFPFEEDELPDGRLPYWFAVQTPPEGMDPELVDHFWEVIEKVKNVRSHIAFVYLNVPIDAKVIARGYVCATRATDAYTCSDTVKCSASLYASGAFDDDECENVFGPEPPEPPGPGGRTVKIVTCNSFFYGSVSQGETPQFVGYPEPTVTVTLNGETKQSDANGEVTFDDIPDGSPLISLACEDCIDTDVHLTVDDRAYPSGSDTYTLPMIINDDGTVVPYVGGNLDIGKDNTLYRFENGVLTVYVRIDWLASYDITTFVPDGPFVPWVGTPTPGRIFINYTKVNGDGTYEETHLDTTTDANGKYLLENVVNTLEGYGTEAGLGGRINDGQPPHKGLNTLVMPVPSP